MSGDFVDEALELLERLEDHVESMRFKDRVFVNKLLELREWSGDELRISRRQIFWLRDIDERLT